MSGLPVTAALDSSAGIVTKAPPTPAFALDPAAPGFNMAALLEHWAAVQPDTAAVAVGEPKSRKRQASFRQRTFSELDRLANRYARAMQSAGLQRGDRVVLFVTDPIEFFALVFACCKLQVIFVLIDPGMGVSSLRRCVEEQAPTAIIGIAKAHLLGLLFPKSFRSARIRMLVGSRFFPGATPILAWLPKETSAEADAPFARRELDPSIPAAIFYTSGSTGPPKGVVFTHAMMGGQAQAIAELFAFRPGEAHVACFPLFALIAGSVGMTAVVPRMNVARPKDTEPGAILEAFATFGAESAFGSPALWEPFSRFVESQQGTAHPVQLSGVTRLLTAGAPVSPALHQRLLLGLPDGDVFTPYGATEALPVAFIGGREVLQRTARATAEGRGTCVGRPVPGVDVRIIGITDDVIERFIPDLELGPGCMGEIIVKGALISQQYDQNPEATERSKILSDDGACYHRMGDVGYLDDDGALWFCGRKSHRVETTARTYFSIPVEAVVERHPSVFRAALTWLGERPNQEPVLCVELEPGITESASLKAELHAELARHEHTRDISYLLFHPSFPVDRRHNAKIEREKLAVWASRKLGER